MGILLNVKTLK